MKSIFAIAVAVLLFTVFLSTGCEIPGDGTTTSTTTAATTTIAPTTTSTLPAFEDINLTMVDIPGGTFEMGCSPGDDDCLVIEKPVHTVTISALKMGVYEITQAQWEMVMGKNPSFFSGCPDCPVDEVSWDNIQEFLGIINELSGETYRLPTEAEWEYAARAGTTTKYYCGDDESCLDDIAWYDENGDSKTHAIGMKEPNDWGLYDMIGNLREYCQDFYDPNYYEESPDTNPQGPDSEFYRILRGGGWQDTAEHSRVSYRSYNFPDTSYFLGGFRICMSEE